jgi:hypothetical protein
MTFICVCISGGLKTKVTNLTERPIDLQVRVGSILKKAYTVKAGRGKTLDCRKIYMSYAPSRSHSAAAFYYDDNCQPYVWIHSPTELNRMVKQQYIGLEDLRDYSEIKICREAGRSSFVVYKKPRSDIC